MTSKTVVAMICTALAVAGVEAASLAEARAKIGDAVSNSAVLTETMKSLSADDQVSFLADVNEAIAKMPGAPESKAAAFLSANRAAIKAASGTGNVRKLLAEAFATVPVEALPAMNESFATELFNRAANPSVTYTDEQFEALAKSTMEALAERNKNADDAAVRDAFAALMLVRASNGTPANLTDTLLTYLPEEARDAAKTEWMPAALAQGEDKSYMPLLDAVGLELEPNLGAVVRFAGSDMMLPLLSDLNNGIVKADGKTTMQMSQASFANSTAINSGMSQGGGWDWGIDRVPFDYNVKTIRYGTGAGTHGSGRKIGDGPVYDPVTGKPIAPGGTPIGLGGTPIGPGGRPIGPGGREIEPHGYQYQT